MINEVSGLAELQRINLSITKSMERISTGLRINRPSDDPAGYAAAKMMQREIVLAAQKQENLSREINTRSTISSKLESAAQAGLKISDLLNKASSSAISQDEKKAIQTEISELARQIDDTLKSIPSGEYSSARFNISEDVLQSGTQEQLTQAAAAINSGVEGIVRENQAQGIGIKAAQTRKNLLAQNRIDIESSLSAFRDSDVIEEMIGLANQNILQTLAIKSIRQTMANETAKALNLLA